jgi:hypothetical protein
MNDVSFSPYPLWSWYSHKAKDAGPFPNEMQVLRAVLCFVREGMQEGLKVDNVFQMNSISSSNRNARTQQPSNIWPIQMQKLPHQTTLQVQSEPKDCS